MDQQENRGKHMQEERPARQAEGGKYRQATYRLKERSPGMQSDFYAIACKSLCMFGLLSEVLFKTMKKSEKLRMTLATSKGTVSRD